MTTSSKKQIERRQFDRFRHISGLLAIGEIVEDEEPDFLVSDSRVVGVELTDLFWEEVPGTVPHQAIEALRTRIAKEAWRRYEARHLPAVHVSVYFNPSYVARKQDVKRLSESITSWAAAHIPQMDSEFSEEYDWENREYFPEEVDHLGIWRFHSFNKSFFSSPGAAFIPELTRNDIKRALRLKEPKVQTYRQKCVEAWLVINCDGGRLSNVFELEDAVLEEDFVSSFDRVFIFHHMAGRIHELSIQRL